MAYLNQQLKTAVENKDESTMEQLLECGADPNAFLSGEDIAPIHLGPGISKSITSLLLKYGGDPNLRTSDGITPLHIAAIWGNKSIIKLLLHNGANVYIHDDEGFTPLDMAKRYEHEKCEIILKQHLHTLESQTNNKKRKVRQKPPLNTKTETNSKRVIDNNRNVDANQNLSIDPEYRSSRIKRENPRCSESTDESLSGSPKDEGHPPQAFSLTSTSASEEITSESISSDEFKRYLETKELLSPEEKTILWVNKYFDADMSSCILPALNSSGTNSNIKFDATAANMKNHRYIELENLSNSVVCDMTEYFKPAIRTDFLETCSSSKAIFASIKIVSSYRGDSNEDDDIDEVDHVESNTYPMNYCGNEEFGKDESQPISAETKVYGETYKTKLSQADKRRKSNNIEFLHTDPEMHVQFIERQISAENQNGDQLDDSESTEIYEWKSFSKSFDDDRDNLPQTENKSLYWRTCGDKPDDVKTNVKKSKKPLTDLGCLSDAQFRQTLIDHGLSRSISTKCQYSKSHQTHQTNRNLFLLHLE